MAWRKQGVQTVTYTLRDYNGDTSTMQLNVPDTVILEDVDTWAKGTGLANLEALTDAVVVGISINQSYYDDAPATPPSTSNVERKGSFTFRADNGLTMNIQVPSIDRSLVVPGSHLLTGAAVDAFVAMVVDEGLFDLVGLVSASGAKLTGLYKAPVETMRRK